MLGWLFTLPDEGLLHRAAGGIGGVDDAPMAVAALAGEVQLVLVVVVAGEGHALGDQPFDRLAAALDHEAHRVVVAQARPGDVGVADVVFERVRAVQDGGDAPLGPARGPVQELVLGHQGHLAGGRPGGGRPTFRPDHCR